MARPTNQQFALAVHVLTLIAHEEAPMGSEALAGSAGASAVHVRRVLGVLKDAGLVTSRPGPHGGSSLARSPEAVTLADVFRALHGEDPVLGLHMAAPDCTQGQAIQARLVDLAHDATAALVEDLSRTTLADLARQTAPAATR